MTKLKRRAKKARMRIRANAAPKLNWLLAVISRWPSPRFEAMNSPNTAARIA